MERGIAVHLKGCFNLTERQPLILRNKKVVDLLILPLLLGLIGNVGQANYSAAKLGL